MVRLPITLKLNRMTAIEELNEEIQKSEKIHPYVKDAINGLIQFKYLTKEKEQFKKAVIDAHKQGEVCKKEFGTLTTRALEYYNENFKAK